jgi:hypothetical protein
MKISVLLSFVTSKNVSQDIEDLSNIAIQLGSLNTNENSLSDINLQDKILSWQYDAFDASQASKSEFSNRDVHTIVGQGSVLNLEAMISIMVPSIALGENDSGKFSKYGCYCNPKEAEINDDIWVGKGQHVDEIDGLCRQLFLSYKCLSKDFDSRCTSVKSYSWKVGRGGNIVCGEYFFIKIKGQIFLNVCRLFISSWRLQTAFKP